MRPHLDRPAELTWQRGAVTAPRDWSGAEVFPTLRQALEAAVDRMGDGPWIRVDDAILPPGDIDDLWKEVFRSRSD